MKIALKPSLVLLTVSFVVSVSVCSGAKCDASSNSRKAEHRALQLPPRSRKTGNHPCGSHEDGGKLHPHL